MTLFGRLAHLWPRRSQPAALSARLPLLFLHIPKTAGTSFRVGAVGALGSGSCHFDYGQKQRLTSRLVLRHAYEQPDLHRLGSELDRVGCRFLGGHFGYRKYAALFAANRVVAFLRHPRDQLLSHFAHLRREGGFKGDLVTFLRTRHGAGCQTRAFSGFHLEAFGLVGVTERYADSLRVLEADFGLQMEQLTRNVSPRAAEGCGYEVPEELRGRFEDAIAEDMPTWQRANELLDGRLATLAAGKAWVHGAISVANTKTVSGFAWFGSHDAPVELELIVNNEVRACTHASQDRPPLRAWNVPRNAFVGFDFRSAGLFAPGDRIEVNVAGSGQVLGRTAIGEPVH
ncbi:MAG: hypothetical protein R3F22_10155 [Lysobacteraceae bacterium]